MDLVRPLLLAGVRGAVVAPPWKPARFSRFRRDAFWVRAPWEHQAEMLDALLDWAHTREQSPVLFYESDGDLLFVSRHRSKLRNAFRFVIADATLVEQLVDKASFYDFTRQHELPVPRSIVLTEDFAHSDHADLRFPVVVKPATHGDAAWRATAGAEYVKARQVSDPDALRALLEQVPRRGHSLIAQELVPGDETRMESYHVYVSESGEIVAEFTGQKVRTIPPTFGRSTALCLTNAADVRHLGRDIVQRIGLTGVAKLDFKRDPHGRLWLLEINPRFTLWNHLGAAAGINIPAIVYADLTGTTRPPIASVPKPVKWSILWSDLVAARQYELSVLQWLRSVARYEIKSPFSWDDPLPAVGLLFWDARVWLKRRIG